MPEPTLPVPLPVPLPVHWGLAATAAEKEEVYSFRYRHYFCHLTDAPGVDHANGRVHSPHDEESDHLTGRNDAGELVIAASGTRADVPDLPDEWRSLLQLDRLAELGLENTIISARLVEREEYRGSAVFTAFFKYSARHFVERGFAHSIQYCAPALVPQYERVGYRVYGNGRALSSGLFRVPMILAGADAAYLGRANPLFKRAVRGLEPAGDIRETLRVLPELTQDPLCILDDTARLDLVRGFLRAAPGGSDLPDHAARALKRGSLLRPRENDSLIHPNDTPLFWLLLEGNYTIGLPDGETRPASAGMLINGRACASLTAVTGGALVVFAPCRDAAYGRDLPAVLPPSFWQELDS